VRRTCSKLKGGLLVLVCVPERACCFMRSLSALALAMRSFSASRARTSAALRSARAADSRSYRACCASYASVAAVRDACGRTMNVSPVSDKSSICCRGKRGERGRTCLPPPQLLYRPATSCILGSSLNWMYQLPRTFMTFFLTRGSVLGSPARTLMRSRRRSLAKVAARAGWSSCQPRSCSE